MLHSNLTKFFLQFKQDLSFIQDEQFIECDLNEDLENRINPWSFSGENLHHLSKAEKVNFH